MLDFFSNLFKKKGGDKFILSLAIYGSFSLIVFVRYGRIFRPILSDIRNYLVAFIDLILVVAFIFGLILSIFSLILLAILIFDVLRRKISNLIFESRIIYFLAISITFLVILIIFLAFLIFVFENELPIGLLGILKSILI